MFMAGQQPIGPNGAELVELSGLGAQMAIAGSASGVALLGLLIASCSSEDQPNKHTVPPPVESVRAVDAAGLETASWQGDFATGLDDCDIKRWSLGENTVIAHDGSDCQVDRVSPAAGQITLSLTCMNAGVEHDEEWIVRDFDRDNLRLARKRTGKSEELELVRCP